MKTVEFDEQCKPCNGTGLYIGMAERNAAAVVCHTCNGTGRHHFTYTYEPFKERQKTKQVIRVYATNPGICIGSGTGHKLEDFGGMPFKDWESGKPFPLNSENRKFTCPAWWYQSADYDKKPNWDECGFGTFSSCKHFANKDACWARWDRENKPS